MAGVVLGLLSACGSPPPPYESARLEAENLAGGRVIADATASGHSALWLVRNESASGTLTGPIASTWLEVRARGDQCAGAPTMTVRIDGQLLATTAVPATNWTSYGYPGTWAAGPHTVTVGFSNDYRSATCDRNLRVDYVAFRSTVAPPPPAATNLFANTAYYVDPASTPAQRVAALRASGTPTDLATAAELAKIAGQPAADWFTDATPTAALAAAVRSRVDVVTNAGRLPVLVAYAIPQRDCNGQSAGGVADNAAYSSWISAFAAGIGSRRAVVVLEPDSVAQWTCLDAAAQQDRVANLRKAVSVLSASGTVAVYLDGGHSNWQTPAVMADRLRQAGVTGVRGFVTNVANYNPTPDETAYADQVAALLGGKHYVVDTSRNGIGSGGAWCNPSGQALGSPPTTRTASAAADAYFWIKRPGESDGLCNGGPAAGQWFESYALGLATRATW